MNINEISGFILVSKPKGITSHDVVVYLRKITNIKKNSAKKVKGQKLYDLARKNIIIDREASLINIYKIKLIKYRWPILKIKIDCSTGTYIRSLAYDIGLDLYCGAYLKNLKRTKIGKYKLRKAYKLNKLNNNNWNRKICVE